MDILKFMTTNATSSQHGKSKNTRPRRRPRPQAPQLLLPTSGTLQATEEELLVDQLQSFEMARVVITATISNILFLRGLFSDNCFEGRQYEFDNPNYTYKSFMEGTNGFGVEKSSGKAYWVVLVPGKDDGVNKVLGWLDGGVADALQRKYLASLQFSIYDKSVAAGNLVEAYIINVTYSDDVASLQVHSKSRSNTDSGEKTLLLVEAKKDIMRLVNMVTVQTYKLDDEVGELPIDGYMNILLTYTQNCPIGYNPVGFKACPDPELEVSTGAQPITGNAGLHIMQVRLHNRQLSVRSKPTALYESHRGKREIPSQSSDGQTQESALDAFTKVGATRDIHNHTQDTQLFRAEPSRTSDIIDQQYTQPVLSRISEAQKHKVDEPHPCECEVEAGASEMLECDICSGSKHAQCYGYLGTRPNRFVCYTCLLISHKRFFTKMKKMCIKRRTLYHFKMGGDVSQVGEYTSRKISCLKGLLEGLRKDGCITMAGKWNITETSQGKATELPVVQFIKDSNYFQPHLHIEHYFVLPPSQDNLLQSSRHIGSSTQGTPNSRISGTSIVSSARETLNPVDAHQHLLKSPLTSSKRPFSNSTMGVVLSSKRPRNVTAITSPYGFRRTR